MALSERDIQGLRDRGVSVVDEFAPMDPSVFAGVLAAFDAQGGGDNNNLLVYRLRAAARGDRAARAASVTEREAAYGRSIVESLAANLPEVFTVNPKVVEATRLAYGDVEANRLAASASPHPAAVAAVMRQSFQAGQRTLKPSAVRAAVREFDARALSDLKDILRDKQAIESRGETG